MNKKRLARCWTLLLAGLLALSLVQAAPPPAEAFFQEPLLGRAALSPDGRLVALRVGAKGVRARLAVLDLATLKPTIVATHDHADVREFRWVNDKRLVYDLDVELTGPNRAEYGQGLFAVNADASGFRQLVERSGSVVRDANDARNMLSWDTYLLGSVRARQDNDVFVTKPLQRNKDGIDYIVLQRVDTRNGRAQEIDTPDHSFDWIFSPEGELRAVVTHKDNKATVLWGRPGDWKKIAEYDELGTNWLRPRFIAPDGSLYVEAPQADKSAIFKFDVTTGQRVEPAVAASKDFDLHAWFIASDSKLLGLRYVIDAEVTQWLDPGMAALQASIDALLPNTVNRLSVAQRGQSPWLLIEAFADVQPTLTLAYNSETRKLVRLGVTLPGIDPKLMGQTDFVRIPARDGRPIPTYLTLPPGAVKKNLPTVVLVHGGPWVRGANWAWNAEVQFLASRGYAVLQPQFRGSTGFGSAHFRAGFKQWGRAMQDDVADATRWAIAQGHADARRICIAGASYGGYATLMGLANDPDLYRCGINWVGVTDIDLMYTVSWSDLTNRWKQYGMPRMIGDPVEDAAMLKAVSPLHNAAKIRQPLLMAYGAWDLRVPLIHGEKFRDANKPHNPGLEWLVYDNEGHGWARAENRVDFWNRVDAFLMRHLAPN